MIVTIMQVPQSLAYAVFGTRRAVAVLAATIAAVGGLGFSLSLALVLCRTSRLRMAQMLGIEPFRNVACHPVITGPRVLSIRGDESTVPIAHRLALAGDGRPDAVR